MPLSRAMGFTEYYSKFCHDKAGGTTNLVGMTRVTGPLDREVLNRALGIIGECHPSLRSSLNESPQGDAMIEVEDRLLYTPFVVRDRDSAEDWITCFENDMQAPFKRQELPWRVTLLQGGVRQEGAKEIVASFHHSLSDGISLATFFGCLLQCCCLIGQGREPGIAKAQPLPALEDMLAKKMGWSAFLARKLALSRKQTLTLRKHLYRYEESVPLKHRRSRILPCELDPEQLERLLFMCRHKGTTLTGLLTASLMISVCRVMDKSGNARKCKHITMTPVSLRNRCAPEVGLHQLGCYVGFAQTTHSFDAETDVWRLARLFNRELQRFNRRGILPPKRYSRKTVDLMLHAMEKGMFKDVFQYGVGVTNIGRLPYNVDFGTLQLEAFHFGTCRRWGDWMTLLHCSTLRGRLFLNFCYADPLISPRSMTYIKDVLLTILHSI